MHAAELVDERLEQAVAPTGLSLPKLVLLQHLVAAGAPLPLGQLAERIDCVKSNVTQLVDRLEGEGLVRREVDVEDRRVVRAVITVEGRRRCEEGARARAAAEAELMDAIPEALRPALEQALSHLQPLAAHA